MAKTWTEENEDFIREHFRHKTYAELADHFGVSQKAMESKIRRMGLKKQDYKEPDPMPAVLPPQPMEESAAPVETGPTPIKSASLLPRRPVQATETPAERQDRLDAERSAAEEEKGRRAEMREGGAVAKALKKFEMGVKRYNDGAFGKALESFQAVVALNPPDSVLMARTRQYLAGLERRARSSDFSPQDADDHYLFGVVSLNAGDPATALEAFALALDQAPGDDRILYCQAAALAQKGDADAAINALRAAVDINDANRVYAQNDPDFVPLRVHEDFRGVVSGDGGL
ncbi:MAG TPA: hypothetical protein QGG47_03745 [Acidobacteriota bacterium]|nr:hypothetical protein [Acidobacteriota bacterium]